MYLKYQPPAAARSPPNEAAQLGAGMIKSAIGITQPTIATADVTVRKLPRAARGSFGPRRRQA